MKINHFSSTIVIDHNFSEERKGNQETEASRFDPLLLSLDHLQCMLASAVLLSYQIFSFRDPLPTVLRFISGQRNAATVLQSLAMHAPSDVQLVIPSSHPHGHRSSLHPLSPLNHHTSHRLDILAASLPKIPKSSSSRRRRRVVFLPPCRSAVFFLRCSAGAVFLPRRPAVTAAPSSSRDARPSPPSPPFAD